MVVVALTIVDAAFYSWTLTALNQNILTLAARKQMLKLGLFQNLRLALLASLFLSVSWIVWAASFIVNDPGGLAWELEWSKEGALELSYLAVLVTVAYLWAPSKNSQRYAHSLQLASDDNDDEGLEMLVPSPGGIDEEYLDDESTDDDGDIFSNARAAPTKQA